MLRLLIHYGCHFVVPLLFVYFVFPKNWKRLGVIFLLAMLIDLDHLLATPIFDPNRCSIGYHPLHSGIATLSYIGLLIFPKTRIWGVALLWHLLTDWFDCWML